MDMSICLRLRNKWKNVRKEIWRKNKKQKRKKREKETNLDRKVGEVFQ